MMTEAEWNRCKADLLERHATQTGLRGHFPMLAFVERMKAVLPLAANLWIEVTDPQVIEYAKANWKPHRYQEALVTCDPNDPNRVDVICVVLPQV